MGTRYVGLGKEVDYGVVAAATRYLEAITSFSPDPNWVIPPPIVDRAYRKRNLGRYRTRGTIGEFPVEPENIGELLYGVFGSVSSAQQGGTSAYLHTFSPGVQLPSYTIHISTEEKDRRLPGGLVESLTVRLPYDGDGKTRAEIFSGFVETTDTILTPTISTLQALNMQNANSILTIAGLTKRVYIYDLEITIKNNIPFDLGSLDGRTASVKRTGQREVTGKFSAFFDETEYNRFVAGTEFTLIVQALGPIITGSYPYYLAFELRKCVYLKNVVADIKPQNEPMIMDAPFKAFYDATGGFNAEAKATLQNTIPSY